MDVPAGIAATLDRLAAIVGPRATTALGVLHERGRSEAYHEHRPPDTGTIFHPASGLRA